MNDIDIIYYKKIKKYILNIETAYVFNSYKSEKEYLLDCLNALNIFMDENGYNKNNEYVLYMSSPKIDMIADNIEDLYTQFKIFVNGY